MTLIVLLSVLVIWNFQLINYGIGQGLGQLKIVWNAKPVSEYLSDSTVADSIKQKLTFIKKVREYAVTNLDLQDTENYTTMYDQKGEPLLWVVTGCDPYSFTAKEWEFPLLGNVPYKGFFELEKAKREFEEIKAQGMDAGIRTVGGWSTLGWFKDPILSKMLERDWGDLANLIIHELVHSTIFVKDSVEFNENLASFIGHEGALLFLEDSYGSNSSELTKYKQEHHDQALQTAHILRGTEALNELYNDFYNQNDQEKLEAKNELIKTIMNTTDTLSFYDSTRSSYLKGKVPNNTYFMSYKRYESKREDLLLIYQQEFDGNLKRFIGYLKQKHPFL